MKKIFIIFLLLFLTACQANQPAVDESLSGRISGDKILNSLEIDDIRCDSQNRCVNHGRIITYDYITDKIAPVAEITAEAKTIAEDMSRRTANSQHFKISDSQYQARFYAGVQFYQKDGRWYQVETATTTVKAWRETAGLFDKLKSFFGFSAKAADYYAGAGDGRIGADCTERELNWTICRATSTASATLVDPTVAQQAVVYSQNNTYVQRSFFPINTSAIPSEAIISSATFNIYSYETGDLDADGNDYLAIVQTTQPSETTFTLNDFDLFGDTAGSAELSLNGISINEYNTLTLNSTGKGWIKKSGEASVCGASTGWTCFGIREGHDLENDAPGGIIYHKIYFSEQAGTDKDPYLSVIYALGSGGGGAGEAVIFE